MRDTVEAELFAWGESQADVRAMVLTSTRAVDGAVVDRFSDYDVIVITRDIQRRFDDRTWLRTFGDVVIDWWDPLEINPDSGLLTTGNVVYYPGTRKIDFTLWPVEMAGHIASRLPAELDAAYRVLLDKDAITSDWPAPTGHGYAIHLPDCEQYQRAVSDFFIGVPYVITALQRGELLPARWVLDFDMRYEYLLPMLQWQAAVVHGPTVRIGNLGKGIRSKLPEATWQHLERTYANFSADSTRAALFEMIDLFRDSAEFVGEAIGCEYPADLHERVMRHINALEAM